jgi:hypothetical protein
MLCQEHATNTCPSVTESFRVRGARTTVLCAQRGRERRRNINNYQEGKRSILPLSSNRFTDMEAAVTPRCSKTHSLP